MERHDDSPSSMLTPSQLIRQFEEAWTPQASSSIDDFLKKAGEHRLDILIHLIHVDIERRFSHGTPAQVEDYLHRFPDLHNQESLLLRLILWEFQLCQRFQKAMSPADIQRRFPSLSERIQTHLERMTLSTVGGTTALLGEVPETIGPRYRVQRTLGTGSFGTVYLAQDSQLNRLVAIKVPHPYRMECSSVDASVQEGQNLAALDHPHIIPVYDIGQMPNGSTYLVSKYVQGNTLAERIAQGSLARSEVIRIVAALADALHHSHTHGLVHRDVKPGNVLIDEQGTPYLADFGLALLEKDVGTWSGTTGTPAYMSPEQAQGHSSQLDGRADIFSLGIMLYEMLTGRRPFRGNSHSELLNQILTLEVRPPRQWDDTIPMELERICLKALQKDMTLRYSTAKDMGNELRAMEKMPAPKSFSNAVSSDLKKKYLVGGLVAFLMIILTVPVVILLLNANKESPNLPSSTRIGPLTSELNIYVFRPGSEEGLEIGQHSDAVPVRTGDGVQVHVKLNQPGYVYILWLDGKGTIHPYYPWEIRNNHRSFQFLPEPLTKVVEFKYPPATGTVATGPSGLETIILVARLTPLPSDFDWETMIPEDTRTFPLRKEREVVIRSWDRGENRVRRVLDQDRGPSTEMVKIDTPLSQLMERLQPHFDSIRAVRFAFKARE